MSRVYKNVCDGCGKTATPSEVDEWSFFNTIKTTKMWMRLNIHHFHKEFDLCEDCVKKVYDIIGGKK